MICVRSVHKWDKVVDSGTLWNKVTVTLEVMVGDGLAEM